MRRRGRQRGRACTSHRSGGSCSLEDTLRLFLWSTARGGLSAGVRLGLAGTYEAQRMLAELGPVLDAVAERCGALGADDLAQPAPLLDLLAATHDRLHSRLFQS